MAINDIENTEEKYLLSEGLIDNEYDMSGLEYLPELPENETNHCYNALRKLYQDMTLSIFSVFDDGSMLTLKQVLYIYLLKYRYITNEQFTALFPYSKSYLAVIASRNKEEIKKYTDSGKTYYCLTSAAYSATRALVPETYLYTEQISAATTSLGKLRTHELRIAGIPYTLHRIKYRDFEWYRSIATYGSCTIRESVIKSGKAKSKGPLSATISSNTNVADGIALFDDGRSAIFEVDCNTETVSSIIDKLEKYTNYFGSIKTFEDARKCQIIISIEIPVITSQMRARQKGNTGEKKPSAYIAFEKAKEIAENEHIENINALLKYVEDLCSRRNAHYSTYAGIKNLIKDYVNAGNDTIKGIDELEKYATNKEVVQLETKRALRRRKQLWERICKCLQYGKENEKDLSLFSKKGISLVVTDNFDRFARFIMYRVSGFFEHILTEIKIANHGNKITLYYKQRNIPNTDLFLNNLITAEEPFTMYTIAEISYDVSEYVHMVQLMNRFNNSSTNKAPIHFIFLVSSVESAVNFVKQTSIDEKFYHAQDMTKPDSNNVTIRFLNYSDADAVQGKLKYFVVDEDGNIAETEDI